MGENGPTTRPGLPTPVARFLDVAYPDGPPEVDTVVIEGSGRFRRRPLPWIPFRDRISLRTGRDRVSDMAVVLGPFTIMRVLDAYVDGSGITKFLRTADVGDRIDQGSLHPLLCEALMFPSCWSRIPGFAWEPVHDGSARMFASFRDGIEVVTVGFDRSTGFPATYEVPRFKGKDGPKVDWRIDMLDWRRFGSVVLPGRIDITWTDDPGPWMKMRFTQVTTGEAIDEPIARARAAITEARVA
jgi:Family of unknown function (DUF6544)